MKPNIELIARICHETNRAWCEAIGDHSQKPWDQAEDWQRESAIAGVKFALRNCLAPESAQHDAWMADKLRAGWRYGPVKDADKKEHPAFCRSINSRRSSRRRTSCSAGSSTR